MSDSDKIIIVVDDERDTLNQISRTLRRVGYVIRAFSSPDVFIQELRTIGKFDLLLTDMDLGPAGTGAELIRVLRECGCRQPMILWSGGRDIDLISVGSYGPDLKMRKGDADLIDNIRRLLGQD